jgi:hypothetical protein
VTVIVIEPDARRIARAGSSRGDRLAGRPPTLVRY